MRAYVGAVLIAVLMGGCGATSAPREASRAFPGNAFGFRFGSSVADVEGDCFAMGGRITSDPSAGETHARVLCSGSPPMMPAGPMMLAFCGDPPTLCAMFARTVVDTAGAATLVAYVRGRLDGIHSAALVDSSTGSPECMSAREQGSWDLVARGECDLRSTWDMPGGRISLVAARARPGAIAVQIFVATTQVTDLLPAMARE